MCAAPHRFWLLHQKPQQNSSWRSPSRRFLFPTTSPFPLDKTSFLVGSGGQYWQEMSLDLSGRLALWSYDSSSAVVNRGANHPQPCCQQPARAAPGRAGSLWGRGCPAGSTAALQGRREMLFWGVNASLCSTKGGFSSTASSCLPPLTSRALPCPSHRVQGAGGGVGAPVPRARPHHRCAAGPRSPPTRWKNASAGLFCICN